MGPYGINALLNGLVPGYSANVDNANLIVENIMMNDGRNGTEYRCVLFNNMGTRLNESDLIILYVAGEYQYNMYTVILTITIIKQISTIRAKDIKYVALMLLRMLNSSYQHSK